jgi:hypothetical protein
MAKDTLKERVRKILSEHISTRNSDEELTMKYWEIHHGVVGPDINIRYMFGLPTHKDIARYRAVIQNDEHQYIPTVWAVAKARAWNEQRWRRILGYPVYEPTKPIAPVKEDIKTDEQEKSFDIPEKKTPPDYGFN